MSSENCNTQVEASSAASAELLSGESNARPCEVVQKENSPKAYPDDISGSSNSTYYKQVYAGKFSTKEAEAEEFESMRYLPRRSDSQEFGPNGCTAHTCAKYNFKNCEKYHFGYNVADDEDVTNGYLP